MLEAIKKNTSGRLPKLILADQLLMTLMCWREYRTEFHIGVSYVISWPAACRTIKNMEDALIESEIFHLSGGKSVSCCSDLKTVLLDASEQPAGHPKKRVSLITAERKNASLKKFKQLLILRQDKFFLLIFAMEERMISDFSRKAELLFSLMSLFLRMPDAQGIATIHKNSRIPFKRKKSCPLSEEEKKVNRDLSKQRPAVEHIQKIENIPFSSRKIQKQEKKACSQVQSYCRLLQSCNQIILIELMQEV